MSGFQVVTSSAMPVSGGLIGATFTDSATCPAGKTAVAGGWNNTVGSVLKSSPGATAGTWTISVFVNGAQSGTISTIAICAVVM